MERPARIEENALNDDVVDLMAVEEGQDVLSREVRPSHFFRALAANFETLRR